MGRAFETVEQERFTRELILQLKRGRITRDPFVEKYGVDPLEAYAEELQKLEGQELLAVDGGAVELTRKGLLRVDHFLPTFYDPRYRNARYT